MGGRNRFVGLILLSALSPMASGCSLMPSSGPEKDDIRHAGDPSNPAQIPYAFVPITPLVVDVLASYGPTIGRVFTDLRPPKEIRFGIGDVVSVTIFEAAAGGLFVPVEAGVRPGNFVNLPNQNVDSRGNISVPYAGLIPTAGRTPAQVQQSIVAALRNRAIEPQAVVALVEQRTSLISVLGDVNTPGRFPVSAAGEHVLDTIARAGGPKAQGFDIWVMLERDGRRATAPFGALVYEPANNIWARPGDTIYLYREPQTFLAFGAVGGNSFNPNIFTGAINNSLPGQQGQFAFDAWRISLAEGVARAGGLNDNLAEPSSVFLYRGETRELAEHLGIDCSRFPGPIIPVIYNANLRDPATYFLATKFQMRNKDVIYISNATTVQITKALQYFRQVVASVNDPIVAAQNGLILNNLIKTAR